MTFIVFDTEDDSKELLDAGKSGFDKRITKICALTCGGTRFINDGDVPEFLRWLTKRPETTIFAHNLQYDLGNLFGDSLDEFDPTLVGGRMIKARWRGKTFQDSFNHWPMSLEKLGDAFGLKKLAMNIRSDAYVMRDVDILRASQSFIAETLADSGIETIPATLGGICVKLWRAWGGENTHETLEMGRAALYGGRVELFKIRNESVRVRWCDVNSLYPSMMLKPFPGPLLEWSGTELPEHGVADVEISVPRDSFCGPLPVRSAAGRIYYPVGKLRGTWIIPEIQNAVRLGAKILRVHACFGTNETESPYVTFVRNCYDYRMNATTDAEKMFWKLCMNNLYGRLGSSGVIGRGVWSTAENCNDGPGYGAKVLVEYELPPSREVNWTHAAYVTAYGRIELLKYMMLLGERMIYCDTDSVIFDGAEIPFATGRELGQMKIVERCLGCGLESHSADCGDSVPHWSHVETYAPKMYRVGKMTKAKGVPKHLQKKYIAEGKVTFELPFKFREAALFYDRNNSKKLSVWRYVDKTARNSYDRKNLIGNRYLPCDASKIPAG